MIKMYKVKSYTVVSGEYVTSCEIKDPVPKATSLLILQALSLCESA